MRITIIHNEDAGGELSAEALIAAIREEGYEPRYFSKKPEDLARAIESPGDLIAVAGGDGTVVDVASRLAGRGIPIAVVPAGTANNIANSLGITGTWRSAIARWKRSTPRPVDLGWVSGSAGTAAFIESVGCGLLVDFMVHFENDQSRPEPRSTAEEVAQAREKFRELLRQAQPRPYRVELDGRDFSGSYLLVEAMNMGRLGPGLPLAPEADTCDGLLDVVLLTDKDRAKLDASLVPPAPHEDLPAPPIDIRQAREVVIDPGQDALHVGGEPWPGKKSPDKPVGPVRVWLQERALVFLVPEAGKVCH
jgi:diacylglycerol kinase family enzyme